MKLTSKRLWALSGGICMALLSGPAVSQYSFYVHSGPPEEGEGLEDYSYVSLDGKVTIDPLAIYDDQITANPEYAEGMPDPSVTTMNLRFDYEATSGDELPFEIVLPVNSPAVHSEAFPKGRYSGMRMSFTWDEAIAPPSRVTWYSYSKVIVPNVQKIPVYMHADLLNKAFYSGSEMYRYLDHIRLRDFFHYTLEREVGQLATNVDGTVENTHGCSGWFQFRFFGYIDPGWESARITEDGQLDELPPGITIVDRITHCGTKTNFAEGFVGCATQNGTRIALEAKVFNNSTIPSDVVTLHEIGHTKGLEHEEMEERNIMTAPSKRDTFEIKRDQCPNFSVSKQYVSPDPWTE